jgi:hypothetical protein
MSISAGDYLRLEFFHGTLEYTFIIIFRALYHLMLPALSIIHHV